MEKSTTTPARKRQLGIVAVALLALSVFAFWPVGDPVQTTAGAKVGSYTGRMASRGRIWRKSAGNDSPASTGLYADSGSTRSPAVVWTGSPTGQNAKTLSAKSATATMPS